MAGDVLSPLVESDAPGIGARVAAERSQSFGFGIVAKPAAVLLAHQAISRFDLGVMKNRLAKQQVAIRRHGKIVQRVMRIFAAETGQNLATLVGFSITVGILEEEQVGLRRRRRRRRLRIQKKAGCRVLRQKSRDLSAFAVAIGVFENDTACRSVFCPGMTCGVGGRAGDPESSAGIPANTDWAGNFRELLFTSEEIHLEARIHDECLFFFLGAEPRIRTARFPDGFERREAWSHQSARPQSIRPGRASRYAL